MKALLCGMGIVLAAGALSTAAQAQNYPWCAYYGGQMGGSSNCGFTTFEQCMATVSGIGGFCARNTLYQPPAAPRPLPRQRRHKPH